MFTPFRLALIAILLTSVIVGGLTVVPLGPVGRAQTASAPARKLSRDLENVPFTDKPEIKLLVQLRGPISPAFQSYLNEKDSQAKVQHRLVNFPVMYVKASSNAIAQLAAFDEVLFISLNKPLKKLGHVSATTGADIARNSGSGSRWTGKASASR